MTANDADPAPAAESPVPDVGARKAMLLRVDPAVHGALAKWAADDNRSVNAQIELLLREALRHAGRLPKNARPLRGPGRPAADSPPPQQT